MIATGERMSDRFQNLCEYLEEDTLESREQLQAHADACYLHLMIWYTRWGGDEEMDTGIFWDVSEKRMGLWAEYHNPLKFGRALVRAGYCKPVNDVFPEFICGERDGFVIPGQLDSTWESVHRHRRAQLEHMVPYLLDRQRRADWASRAGIDITLYPDGWFDPPGPDPCQTPGTTRVKPELSASDQPAAAAPCPPSDSPTYLRKQKRELTQRNVEKKTLHGRTGKPKTLTMYETVRENRYENPLLALRTIDDTATAMKTWRLTVDRDVSFVQTLLAEMTETHETWAKLENPAAVCMSRCRRRLRELDNVKRPPQSEGGQGAERAQIGKTEHSQSRSATVSGFTASDGETRSDVA
jgi:hypothetical protein